MPRQRRLLDIEIACNQKTRVGRNQISCGEPDNISRHDTAPWHLLPFAVAQYSCRRSNTIPQLLDGPLGSMSLDEVNHPTQ
jgi:hypothetical protein